MTQTAALLQTNARALENLKAWAVKVLAETETSDRYKANLIIDALRDYKFVSTQLANALNTDAASLDALLSNPIQPNEVYTFSNHYGTFQVGLLRWSRLRREIVSQKTQLGITYQGHNPTGRTPESWHIDEMAVFLGQHFETVSDLGLMLAVVKDAPIQPPRGVQLARALVDTVDDPSEATRQVVVSPQYLYNKKNGQRIWYGTLNENQTSDPIVWFGSQGLSQDGSTVYCVKFMDNGYPVFFNALIHTQQDEIWASIRGPVAVIASVVAACYGVPLMVGQYVVGTEIAAFFPLATQTVGSLAMNTALNGGDVNRAFSGAGSNFLGSMVGADVGAALDSDALGQLASAATSATFSGGNVNTAILSRMAAVGAQNMDNLFPATGGTIGDSGDWGTGGIVETGVIDAGGANLQTFDYTPIETIDLTPVDYVGYDVPTIDPNTPIEQIIVTGEDYANALSVDAHGNTVDAYGEIVIAASDMEVLTDAQIADRVGGFMLANAGQTVQTSTGDTFKFPSFIDMAKSAVFIAQSASQIATSFRQIKNGTTPTTGRVTGVPVRRADGSTVVNNGNGTQTVTRPNGMQTTERVGTGLPGGYAGGAGGSMIAGVPNVALFAGVGLLAAVVLMKARK